MPNLNDAPREVAAVVAKQGSKVHPMVIVAAGAVTIFSAVGVGMMTGIIPSAHSDTSAKQSPQVVLPNPGAIGKAVNGGASAVAGTVAEAALPATPAKPASPSDLKPIDSKTIGQPNARAEAPRVAQAAPPAAPPASAPRVVTPPPQVTRPSAAPAVPAAASERVAQVPVVVATASPASGYPAPAPTYTSPPASVPSGNIVLAPDAPVAVARASEPAPAVCRSCGRVESITEVTQAGEAAGAGAALGGVLGGVLGHQAGKGRGRDVATVAGAVGGAILGHQIEKNTKTTKAYDVRVRMEDNTFQSIRVEVAQDFRVGDRVRIEGGKLIRG